MHSFSFWETEAVVLFQSFRLSVKKHWGLQFQFSLSKQDVVCISLLGEKQVFVNGKFDSLLIG